MSVTLVSLTDTLDQWRRKTNDISIVIGDFVGLVSSQPSVIRAINENYIHIGNLDVLSTDLKDNLVDAINEVDFNTDVNTINIGNVNDLDTNDKSSLVNAINELEGEIGDLPNLTTNSKVNLVAAINEVDAHTDTNTSAIDYIMNVAIPAIEDDIEDIQDDIGNMVLNNGQTTLTNAINWNTSQIGLINSDIGDMNLDTIAGNITDAINELFVYTQEIGDLTTLTTEDKTTLVSAINEIDLQADIAGAKLGEMELLDTGYKADLVGAINEVNANTVAMALILG
ncbi:MAG: hypothetical protein DRQ78_05810 [Epsilonproteobacteria bacterium]|nr:MAG: hypothetical protein DRQ78_05810 [Campylobacterota bacterium]